MNFGSVRYPKEELEMDTYFGEGTSLLHIADHLPNQEWLIVDAQSKLVDVDREGKIYQEVRMVLLLKRFSGFYFQFIIIPTLMLATLILTIFFIPPERPDRTSLGI